MSQDQQQELNQACSSDEEYPQVDDNRRNALKKLGNYGVYTAPAMLALLTSKKSRAVVSGGGMT